MTNITVISLLGLKKLNYIFVVQEYAQITCALLKSAMAL